MKRTPKQLLALAVAFDGGPPVVINGTLVSAMSPDMQKDAARYGLRVVRVSSAPDRWVVRSDSGAVLNHDYEWEHESMPSHRTDDFIRRTRYTLKGAFKQLDTWRKIEMKRYNGRVV